MAWNPIAKTAPQYVDTNGDPYSGAVLKAYKSGTSTNISLATDNTGGTTASSVALNADGYPVVSGNIIIPHVDQPYKLMLYPTQAAADSDTGEIWSIDGLSIAEGVSYATVAAMVLGNIDAGEIVFTSGYTSANDGGGAKYLIMTAAAFGVTPDEAGDHTIANGNIAVLQVDVDLNVKQYGVTGDGSTNDTTAITALETAHGGKYVDLQGLTYAVTAIPTGCKYYNGDFIVGSTRTSLRRNRLDNPLDGNSWISYGDGKTHYWFFGMVYVESTGVTIALISPSYRHDTGISAPLNIIYSDDKGQSWYGEKTIHTVDSWDMADACMTIMGSNRIGIFASLRDASSNYRNDFIYSDDNGTTWTVSESEIASPNGFMVYGGLLPYPAVAGGHDTTGFIAYGYLSTNTYYSATTDNGTTWTAATATHTALSLVEPSVVRVPGETKWVSFLRKNLNNMLISTSTDMKTWTAPTDTGIDLGSNPVTAYVDSGRVYVYMFMRDFDASISEQNDLLLIEDDVSAVYDASDFTNASIRKISTGTERAIGYMTILPIEQDFIWAYLAGEYGGSTSVRASSFIVSGSTRRAPSVSLGQVRQLAVGQNILRNPTFEFWSRGTSFAGITAITKVADGWVINPSGSTITASRVELAVEDSRLLPFAGRYAIDISATADDYISLYQDQFGESELYRLADSQITLQVYGLGDVPTGLFGQVLFHYDGSADVSTTVNFQVAEGTDKLWRATATIKSATLEGKTIGASPYVRIIVASASGSAAWDAQICGVKAEIGEYATAFPPIDIELERSRSNRYVRALDFGTLDQICNGFNPTTTAFWGVLNFERMRSAPAITIQTGAAADFEVYSDAAFGSSVAFAQITEDRCSLRVTTTGLTGRDGASCRVKSGSSITLLLDSE